MKETKWLSCCCCAQPLFEVHEWIEMQPNGRSQRMAAGICSKCKDHATFEQADEEGD